VDAESTQLTGQQRSLSCSASVIDTAGKAAAKTAKQVKKHKLTSNLKRKKNISANNSVILCEV
jgi:hypothetical protein